MNRAKIQRKIKNLKAIRDIVEVSKFDTIQKLQRAKKVPNSFFEMAFSAKVLIDFAFNNYKIIRKSPNRENFSTLWVYVTPNTELMSISNSKFQKMIMKSYNSSSDSIIALGDKAVEFANYQKLNIKFSSNSSSDLETAISTSISIAIITGEIDRVNFVINSPKIKDEPITIYPLSELNVDNTDPSISINKKYKFFPSLEESIQSLTQIYIFKMTLALIKESQTYHLKEKLISHESSLKSIDEKINEKIIDINKLNKKNETEDLILVSQIAKRGNDA